MVVVYFGTPQFAVPTLEALLAAGHEVRGVITQPDRPRGRGQKVVEGPVKATAIQHGLDVLQPERLRDPGLAAQLTSWRLDIGVVAAYGRLIPEELLAIPRLGMVNVHASLLPKYRGAAPVHRAVIDGQTETGVTIMQVVKALDAGDMLARARRPIGPDETSDVVEQDLARLGARLLVDTLAGIDAGTIVPEPQDATRSSYAPRLTKEEGVIDWRLPAATIHNRVRGLYPWPHAYTYLDGARLIILKTRILDRPEGNTGDPGKILAVSRDAITVAAGDGRALLIESLQPEGRRPMQTREYLAGRPLRPGATFGVTP